MIALVFEMTSYCKVHNLVAVCFIKHEYCHLQNKIAFNQNNNLDDITQDINKAK